MRDFIGKLHIEIHADVVFDRDRTADKPCAYAVNEFKFSADRYIFGGHGENAVIEGTRACGISAEGIVRRHGGVFKYERYLVFTARVKGAVVLQAAVVFVSRDTAYFVLRRIAGGNKGDVLAGGDGVSVLSLCSVIGIPAERIEVVAVADGSRAVGDKHGAVVVAHCYLFRRKDTVADRDVFFLRPDKAAAAVRIRSEKLSVENAALHRDIVARPVLNADKAAVCAVAVYAADDRQTGEAVGDIAYTACLCHKSRRIHC